MIIPMGDLLAKAKKEGYGVPAPNCFNRESIEACFLAAKELHAPVILDVAYVHGLEECGAIARFYEHKYPEIPVALNLDHGRDFKSAILAIRSGFSSVMVDRSEKPYAENVSEVKEIVKIAHTLGVSVEAELGHVGQGYEYEQTRDAGLTHPDEAAGFVEETEIDCLAVAVGTSHGQYKGTPHIDFDRLSQIAKRVSLPLVLHGGSGTGDENLAKSIHSGIQKVNLFTDLSMAGMRAMDQGLHGATSNVGDGEFACKNLSDAINAGMIGYREKLMHYMKLFGAEGRW
ncbi:class II fructose-bisphosphate aldolase [Caproiciproducens sp. CPB-2]|uniref:class II fructose-bisphosphate aldolase n=1 Tax=Caproiciproducens sp. CPB-2 TaxID=3030017 RepID=UPI0023D98642|nr:class II fructose-bisphosphate aldolase [Caproiciproducens sp. CPB-2]MDF1494543.1 class II fructose-bisphosphate aldolase [Caproiciproducens sp. CPB-2]